MTTGRLEVQRTIAADPAAIFRLPCDPQGHLAIDSSGMLMAATKAGSAKRWSRT
jgi:hypothetical protein